VLVFCYPVFFSYASSNSDMVCVKTHEPDYVGVATGIRTMIGIVYFPTAAITGVVILVVVLICFCFSSDD